jgi:spore coat protein H
MPGKLVFFALAAAAVVVSAPLDAQRGPSKAGDKIFGFQTVQKVEFALTEPEFGAWQTSSPRNGGGTGGTDYRNTEGRLIHVGSGFGGYFPWVKAEMRAGGETFKDVGLRYKGNLSFTSTSADRPLFASMKVKIDVHGTRGAWDGEKVFNFHAGVVDTSKMREALAFAIFRAAGVPAPRTTYAQLYFTVPVRYQNTSAGYFTIIEDVNKTFLERVLPPGTGLLMKPEGLRGGVQNLGADWNTWVTRLRPDREATAHERQRVMEFGQLVSQPDVDVFRSRIGSYLDVEEFLRFLAVNAFIANGDSYLGGGHNFYIYLDPADNKFRFIPWDQDLSMGSRNMGGGFDLLRPYNGDQPLIYWLLDDPVVTARYRAILRELAGTAFSKAELTRLCDALEAVGANVGASPRAFLESRASYVQQLIAGFGGK